MAKKLSKVASGISGFDEISHGGIPKGRTTLVSGTSGSGKTTFAAQFLYEGAASFGENGVFVTFEESPQDIIRNTNSFGWNMDKMIKEGKLIFVDVSPDCLGAIEIGQYDLGAFMARIAYAIKKVKAQRVSIDSVSALFTHYHEPEIIRRELYKLTAQLKRSNVTCVMTAERPAEDGQLSRYGVEESVSDNVILLHNRLNPHGERERTVEILKFRGSTHDAEEAPVFVNAKGMTVYPRLKPALRGKIYSEKISTGIKKLDELLCGGLYRHSTTLITGASGSGKTIAALHFIMEGVKRGEKSLFIEFEESPEQLYRNAKSLGWDLEKSVRNGFVKIVCYYPDDLKAEQYLKMIQDVVLANKTKRVVLDSISDFQRIFNERKFRAFVMDLNTFLRRSDVTAVVTNTTSHILAVTEITETHISTASDNIIILKFVELAGRMHRLISVLKQRGSRHKRDLMEFEIVTGTGINIIGPFEGIENLMSGSARRIRMELGEKNMEKNLVAEAGAGRV